MNDVKNIDIHPVLREWLKAVEQRDADLISSLYAESAVLIPLMSNTIRNGNELIRDYFEQFFKKADLHVQFSSFGMMQKNGHEICSGNSMFSWLEGEERVHTKARYSYVIDNGKILIHHSSYWPED